MNQKLKISKEVLKINPFKSEINENLLDKAFRELDETEDIEDFIYNLNKIVTREMTLGECSHG